MYQGRSQPNGKKCTWKLIELQTNWCFGKLGGAIKQTNKQTWSQEGWECLKKDKGRYEHRDGEEIGNENTTILTLSHSASILVVSSLFIFWAKTSLSLRPLSDMHFPRHPRGSLPHCTQVSVWNVTSSKRHSLTGPESKIPYPIPDLQQHPSHPCPFTLF